MKGSLRRAAQLPPVQPWRGGHLRRPAEQSSICGTYDRVYGKKASERTRRNSWGESRTLGIGGSHEGFGKESLAFTVPENHPCACGEASPFSPSVPAPSGTVIPGCYFGPTKPDGPGTGWRGGGVGGWGWGNLMSHGVLPGGEVGCSHKGTPPELVLL